MQKTVIVDCQLLQTTDANRGMGLFLKSLLRNLVGHKNIKWVFILNSSLTNLDQHTAAILELLGGEKLPIYLKTKKDARLFAEVSESNRMQIDHALRGIIKHSNDVAFYIPALFSSEIFPVFPSADKVKKIQLVHDIIPYLYHQYYLKDEHAEQNQDYCMRYKEFYRTDLYITNSQTTTDDVRVYLGIDSHRVVPIFGAGADRSNIQAEPPKNLSRLSNQYILMPSGDDFRKNNVRAVQAYAASAKAKSLKLVITSNFTNGSKQQLNSLSSNLIFTGSVSDKEYLWLQQNAKLVLFPSEYEGLGMPLVEAAEAGVRIACSNIPVFTEISEAAFYMFNPLSVSDITRVIDQALSDNRAVFKNSKLVHYPAIKAAFNWQKTAKLFIEALDKASPAGKKVKIAVFGPAPSTYSAIGKVLQELHGETQRQAAVDYYLEPGVTAFAPTRPNLLEYVTNCYSASDFNASRAKQYDEIIYHIGNSEFHINTILNALRIPGTMVVHDTKLNGIFDFMQRNGFLTLERRNYETWLDELYGNTDTACLTSLSHNQRRIIVHSRYAEQALNQSKSLNKDLITQANLPVEVPAIHRNKNSNIVSFAGIISENKGMNLVHKIAAIKDTQVKVFGYGVLGENPSLQTLPGNVEVVTDLTDKAFQDNISQSAILVNYRLNYHGETSLSTLEAMRYGVVAIVRDIGWYAELPDDVVIKVKNASDVVSAVKQLLEKPQQLNHIANNARNYIKEHFTHAQYVHTALVNSRGET